MLVTSVGVPDTPPAPAGLPGEPIALSRYDRLMARVSLQLQQSRPGFELTLPAAPTDQGDDAPIEAKAGVV